MDTHKFFVEKLRFHLTEENALVFVGWFFDGKTENHELCAQLDGQKLPLSITVNRGAEVRQKYLGTINEINEEVVAVVRLPEQWREGKTFIITAFYGEEKQQAYRISVKKLIKLEQTLEYYIESCHRDAEKVSVTGWCMGAGEVNLYLLDAKGQPLPVQTEHFYRKDLTSVFPECEKAVKPGFLVQTTALEPGAGNRFCLEMRSAERSAKTRLKKWDDGGKFQYAVEKAGAAVRYLERNGVGPTIRKINTKLGKKEETSYQNWRKKYEVTAEELEEQRQTSFSCQPKFSVLVPVYQTNPAFLRELIDSIENQTYGNWQLCMVGQLEGKARTVAEEYAAGEKRITLGNLDVNAGLSGNTNAAAALAEGDYIVLADHDDILPANALYELAKALNEDRDIEVLYSDEDKVSMDGKTYFEPHFKPDFNLDLLCSMNYICHLFAVKKEVAETAGLFDSAYDGAQDLDFILRCCEQSKKICHIPKILYHWRCHMNSTAANPESKLYAFEAGRAAVEAHYKRCGIPAKVEHAESYGRYRTIYQWQEAPLVSVIIPNKDHSEDLGKCLRSIIDKSEYRNFEIIVVENNSTDPETFTYYEKIQTEYSQVHVIFYEGGFNFSKINNFGAAAAKGDYLLLLNNDTEMINGSVIGELLGCCMREDVGITGAKLLYADDTIQHAGVVLGFGGTAGHAFIGKSRYDTGYFGRISSVQDYSAVTAACMMVKRTLFDQVGGLTEELAVAFNDIDFCLKVREQGKLVIYNPYAELYHYESKSRGYEDSPEKVERFQDEVDKFINRWRTVIEQGDPYYNRNLTLDNSDFSLRR